MRILHIIQTMDPAGGGPPAVVSGLAASLAQMGHTVGIAHEGPQSSAPSASQPISIVSVDAGQAAYHKLLTEFRPDFLHLHGVWCRLLLDFSSLAQQDGIPYCLATHGALGSWSLAQKPLKKAIALRLGYGKMLRQARFLVANNAVELEEVRARRLHRNVQLVPNGITLEQTQTIEPRVFREKFGLGDVPFVLFLGRLTYQKGPDLLLKAFLEIANELRNYQLVFVGPDGGMEKELRSQVERLPGELSSRIKFCGPLYGPEKRSAYRAASVFCAPSRYESFGIVIIEALAMGTPVVASQSCYFPLVDDERLGLSTSLEASQLGRALMTAVGAEEYASNAKLNGPRIVSERFTWEKIGLQYRDLYHRHLSVPEPGGTETVCVDGE